MRELGPVRDQVDLHDSAAFDSAADHRDRFVAAAVLFTTGMYGMAEILASRVPRQEEYIARVPAIAILPWFLAGALFPIPALRSFLTWLAKFLPLTHALALMRYGFASGSTGLHAIWGLADPRVMAALSLAVVEAFALLVTAASISVFSRSAVGGSAGACEAYEAGWVTICRHVRARLHAHRRLGSRRDLVRECEAERVLLRERLR
ncbi:MAG: ABC transporter permease, partial [Actinobacteria bacterium]